MAPIRSHIDFRLGVHAAVLGGALALLCVSFVLQPSPFFDTTTFTASLLIFAVLICAVLMAWRYELVSIDFTVFTMYLYFIPRLVQYQVWPQGVYAPFPDYTLAEVNVGIWAFVPLFAAFLIGLGAAEYTLKSRIPQTQTPRRLNAAYFYALLGLLVALIAYEFTIFRNPENSIYYLKLGEEAAMGMVTKILVTLFSSDIVLFALIAVAFALVDTSTRRQTTRVLVIVFFAVFALILLMTVMGSRSGGFRILLAIPAIYLVMPRSRATLAISLFLVVFSVVSNIVLLPFAQTTRAEIQTGEVNSVFAPDVDADVKGSTAYWVFNRIGYPDYIFVTLARTPAPECVERYMNFSYYGRNIANFIAPGSPFPEATLSTSNAFGRCFRDPERSNFLVYHSEVWSLPGLLKLTFGQAAVLAAFAVGGLVGAVSGALSRAPGTIGRIGQAYWIYLLPFVTLYAMGVDHSANLIITIILRLAMIVFAMLLVQMLVHHRADQGLRASRDL